MGGTGWDLQDPGAPLSPWEVEGQAILKSQAPLGKWRPSSVCGTPSPGLLPLRGPEGFEGPEKAQTPSPGKLVKLRGVHRTPEHPRNQECALQRQQAGLGRSCLCLPCDAVSPSVNGPISRGGDNTQGQVAAH